MNGRNAIFAAVSLFTLSACATIGVNYATHTPVKAITEIAKQYDSKADSETQLNDTTQVRLSAEAAEKTFAALPDYCRVRGGSTIPWERGVACFDSSLGHEVFVVRSDSTGFGGTTLKIAEWTRDFSEHFDIIVSSWGYKSVAETRRRHLQAMENEYKRRKQAEQDLVAQRMRERHKVAYRGAQVCQNGEYMSSRIILIGTVEQVEGDRLKVFIERAVMPGAPDVRPGNFQQHYSWVNVWDVSPCS